MVGLDSGGAAAVGLAMLLVAFIVTVEKVQIVERHGIFTGTRVRRKEALIGQRRLTIRDHRHLGTSFRSASIIVAATAASTPKHAVTDINQKVLSKVNEPRYFYSSTLKYKRTLPCIQQRQDERCDTTPDIHGGFV